MPVNYRVYDKIEGKSKNDYFQDRLIDVLAWGLSPAFVTGDSWYSGIKNFKAVKKHGLSSMFAVKSNRCVSIEKGKWVQVQKLDMPDGGLEVWLRGVGQVKLLQKLCALDVITNCYRLQRDLFQNVIAIYQRVFF